MERRQGLRVEGEKREPDRRGFGMREKRGKNL